jgi:hypothetical protein
MEENLKALKKREERDGTALCTGVFAVVQLTTDTLTASTGRSA